MLLNENLFEAVQESDIRGNYKKKALNKEKLYDKIIDKIQRELSKKGFKVGTDGDYLFVNKKIFKQPNKEGKIVTKSKFMLDKKDYTDLINYLDSIGIEHYFKDDIEGLGLILNINLENVDKIKLTEDIEKTKSGKWVNKGKEGTHGEFETKKAAREQQKAMFAQGYKENFDYIKDINEAQYLVDDAIERFGRIGARLYDELDQAGFYVDVNNKVKYKNKLGENLIREELDEPTIEEMFKYLKEYPQYNGQYTRPAKYYDLDLTPEQQDEFFNFLQDEVNGLGNFWEENAVLSQDIYQEGRMGGHLILDTAILKPKIFDNADSVDEMIEDELEFNYYPNNDDGTYDERQKQDAKEDVEKEIKDSYLTLKDFDERVNKLIENLKATLDARVEDKTLDEKLENNEIDDFFNKAKKLGVKNLGELKRLLNEPEAVGKTEKEKMDNYYKASNPEDKDLTEDTSMTSKTIEESFEDEHLGGTSEEVIPDSVEAGPEAGIAAELNKLIIDEWEAIQGYNDAIVAAELEGYSDIAKVLKDIVNEEMNHVGMLESALVTVSPNTQTIEDGEVEAQEILANEGEITADITEAFDVDKVEKRVARVNEFDNGHVLFNYENITSAEAEEKAKQLSLKYPNDIFYVAYDDVMNPASDIKWKNGQQISNKKELSPNADSIEQGKVEASEQLTEAVDTKQAWLKEMAQDDWDVGHTFDPDDFHEFKKIAKECGFNVSEKDFDKYFEYLEDIRSEYYNSDMDESIKK